MGEGDREAFSDASTKPMARACAPEAVEAGDSAAEPRVRCQAGVKRERMSDQRGGDEDREGTDAHWPARAP